MFAHPSPRPAPRHGRPLPVWWVRIGRLGVGAALALAAAVAPQAAAPNAGAAADVQLATLAPVADAEVSGANNYRNYGTAPYLGVGASPIVRSYLKFAVSGLSGAPLRATLRLYAQQDSPVGASVHAVIGNGWTESLIRFANAYAFGPAVSASGPVKAGTWTSLDVTNLVTGNGTYGFALTSTQAKKFTFSSREGVAAPQLVLSVLSPTGGAAPSPSSSSSPSPSATPAPSTAPTTAPTAAPTPSAALPSAPAPTASSTVAPAQRKLLIHHGFDLPTPAQVASHASLIDARPFDGITVNLTGLSDQTLSGTAHSVSDYANALAAMPTLTHVTHNFVVVRTMNPLDWYGDALWSTVSSNLANLAAAERAKGQFDGIFLDTEFYGSGTYPWNFGTGSTPWTYSATAGATPGHTAADATSMVMGRGTQLGSAVAGAWPSAVVMTTYGPWVGETKTVSTGGWGAMAYNDTAWTNELMGSFSGGLVAAAAANPTLTYVDGGEVYQAHSSAEYQTAYSWMKQGLAASGSAVVPRVSSYSTAVSAGFGVYDKDMRLSGWPVMPSSTWQSVLTNALQRSDRYVWSYSEAYDWLGTGWPTTTVPADILTATANARAAGA